MSRVVFLSLVAGSGLVFAQSTPSDSTKDSTKDSAEEWTSPPQRAPQPPAGELTPPPPPAGAPGSGTLTPPPPPTPQRAVIGAPQPMQPLPPTLVAPLKPPLEPNRASIMGANALGQWKRAASLLIGFPYIHAKFALGLTSFLDVGVSFDTFYTAMNDVRLSVKWNFANAAGWSFGFSVEGGPAFFTQRAPRENNGSRWITGRRNGNLAPGFLISYQGEAPRAARFIVDLRYQLSFDSEPYSQSPLGGVPSGVAIGHNGIGRFAVEIPVTARTAAVLLLGVGFHGRETDSLLMPEVMFGFVASI